MEKNKNIGLAWIGLIFLGLVWGSSFLLIKYGLRSFTYMQVSGIRIFIAFVVLLPLIIKFLPKLTKKDTKNLLFVGFIGNFFPAILFAVGQTSVDSNLAGILNALVPVFVLVLGLAFYRIKTNAIQVTGVFLGLLGAIVLITKDNLFIFTAINKYTFLIILATLCYAVNMNQVNRYLKHLKGSEITAFAFLFIGPVAGIILLFGDYSKAALSDTMLFDLLCVFILGIFGSAIAVIIINYIITKIGAMFASSVTYIIPVIAVFFGIIDGEDVGFLHFIAGIIVLLGVYLVNKKKN